MDVQYKRKLNKSYMILYGETQIPEYQLAMLQSTKPEGLLPVQVIQGPEMAQYHYDITGYQSLDQILQGNALGGELLERILSRLAQTLEQLSCYLLEEERLLLSPAYIFYNVRQQRISYCYCLAQEKEKNGTIKELLEYLLAHLDHNDSQAVKMAYELYQSVVEEQGNLSEMLHEARLHKDEPMVSTMEWEKRTEVRQETVTSPFQKESMQGRVRFCDSTMLQYDRSQQKMLQQTMPQQKMPQHNIPEQKKYEKNQDNISHSNEREKCLTRNMEWKDTTYHSQNKNRPEDLEQTVERNVGVEQAAYQQEDTKKEQKKGKLHVPIFPSFLKKRSKRMESARSLFQRKPVQEQSYLFEPTDMLPQQEEQHTVYLGTREEKQPCCLQYEGEGDERDLLLDREVYLIGSRPSEVDGLLHANTISRMHAQITKMPDGYYLEDLNSMNGTTINGRMLDYKERVRLHPGDEVCFASEHFRFIS